MSRKRGKGSSASNYGQSAGQQRRKSWNFDARIIQPAASKKAHKELPSNSPYTTSKITSYTKDHLSITSDRGLTPWQHIENDNSGFITLQALSAIGLAGVGLTGDFAPQERQALLQTGAGNAGRNIGWFVLTCGFNNNDEKKIKWLPSIPPLAEKMGSISASPKYLLSNTLHAVANNIPTGRNKRLQSFRHTVHKSSKTWKSSATSTKDKVDNFIKNPIGRELIEAPINAACLAGGTWVHYYQAKMGLDMYEATGEMNGHLIGASIAGGAYGLMAMHHLKMMPRLKNALEKFKSEINPVWNDRARHRELGYVAKNQPIQDAIFSWAPPLLLMGKGGAYMYEMTHIHNWDKEGMVPNLPTHLDFDMLTDIGTLSNTLMAIDYSNTLTATSSALMFTVGAVFTKSAYDEFMHQNKKKINHIVENYVNIPTAKPSHFVVDGIENALEKYAPDMLKNSWQMTVKPALAYNTPKHWIYEEPTKFESKVNYILKTLDDNDTPLDPQTQLDLEVNSNLQNKVLDKIFEQYASEQSEINIEARVLRSMAPSGEHYTDYSFDESQEPLCSHDLDDEYEGEDDIAENKKDDPEPEIA